MSEQPAKRPSALYLGVKKLNSQPAWLRSFMINWFIGRKVPFVKTAGVKFLEISRESIVVQLKNRRKSQNHIGQAHAAAMALCAETATGFMVSMNASADQLPLCKSLNVDYVARSSGTITAVCEPPAELLEQIRSTEKGEAVIPVKVTDEAGTEPIVVEAIWVWIPKKR